VSVGSSQSARRKEARREDFWRKAVSMPTNGLWRRARIQHSECLDAGSRRSDRPCDKVIVVGPAIRELRSDQTKRPAAISASIRCSDPRATAEAIDGQIKLKIDRRERARGVEPEQDRDPAPKTIAATRRARRRGMPTERAWPSQVVGGFHRPVRENGWTAHGKPQRSGISLSYALNSGPRAHAHAYAKSKSAADINAAW